MPCVHTLQVGPSPRSLRHQLLLLSTLQANDAPLSHRGMAKQDDATTEADEPDRLHDGLARFFRALRTERAGGDLSASASRNAFKRAI